MWDDVVGQPAAVAALQAAAAPRRSTPTCSSARPGSTKHDAARAFAALLLTGADEPDRRDARLALRGEHPDVHEVERTGPAISAEQAREIIHVTSLAPVEGARKIVVLHDFHLLTAEAAARLLKSIEEPPPSTTFLVLADFVPPELITIASRCVRIEFRSIPDAVLAARLRAEGVADDVPSTTSSRPPAATSPGRASSPPIPTSSSAAAAFADRARRGSTAPARPSMATVDDLLARIEAAAAPLAARHAAEVAELEARIERFGERGSGRKALEERHQPRAAPPPHRRAAQRARASSPAPTATCSSPGRRSTRRRVVDAVDAHPRRGRVDGAQPERGVAAAIAALVAAGHVTAGASASCAPRMPADAVERGQADHGEGDAVDRATDAVELERRAGRRRSARSGRRARCGRRRTAARRPPRSSAARAARPAATARCHQPSRPNASSSAGMPPTMHADQRQHRQHPDDEAEAERGRQVEQPARHADHDAVDDRLADDDEQVAPAARRRLLADDADAVAARSSPNWSAKPSK